MRGLALARLACASAIACGAAGCGDGRPTRIVPEQAAATVRTLALLRDTMTTNDGFAVASAVPGVAAQAAAIVQPDEQQQRLPPPVVFAVGTCQCDAGGCVFNGCGDDAGSWTVDGSIVVSGSVYTFDVSWSSDDGEGFTQSWSYAGALTMTDASIEGELSGRGDFVIVDENGGRLTIDWAWDVDLRPVMIDDTGCAVGGSMGVDGDIKESVQGRSLHWSGGGTVSFGPTCGVATVD